MSPPVVIELRRVDIPGYLDRPEIVRTDTGYQVHLSSNDRWSEPFGDLLQRVLTDDLTRRLPGATVFSTTGALSQDATRIVEVDIGRLDADGAGQVVLDAQYVVRVPNGAGLPIVRQVHLTVPSSTDAAAYAAAISNAAGQLADQITAAVKPAAAPDPLASAGGSS